MAGTRQLALGRKHYYVTHFANALASIVLPPWLALARLIPGIARLPSLSIAGKSAWIALVFSLILWAGLVADYLLHQSAVPQNLLIAAILPPMVAAIVYWIIAASSGKRIADRNLHDLWNAGIQACEQQGIAIDEVPIFLVLGSPNRRQTDRLIQASQLPMNTVVPPRGNSDITFFANRQAIFIFVDGCSCLSALSTGVVKPTAAAPRRPKPTAQSAPVMMGGTIVADMFPESSPAPEQPQNQEFGTVSEFKVPATRQSDPHDYPGPENLEATLTLPEPRRRPQDAKHNNRDRDDTAPEHSSVAGNTDSYQRKLRYLCRLLKRERGSLCPVNGILTTLPLPLVENNSCDEITRAIDADLAVLADSLGVRCANTVLVTHINEATGCTDLVKRVGVEKSRESRFGKGCDVWHIPQQQRIDAIAQHAVGAFEVWIHSIFQRENSPDISSNSRLFRLLSRIRGRFAENFHCVLGLGFGVDPAHDRQPQSNFLFGGCYFAATGTKTQAFVKSVFKKVIEREADFEWTNAAQHRNQRLEFAAGICALVATATVLLILGIGIWKLSTAA